MTDRIGSWQPESMVLMAKQLATASAVASLLNHEIKNALASVLAGLQALEKGTDLSADDNYVLSLLMDEVRSLNSRIQGLLSSVRTDATPFGRIGADRLLAGCLESLSSDST
jgi:nitrogen-specific signal transduction histidine kinase